MDMLKTLKRFKLLNITDMFRASIDSARAGDGLPPLTRYLNERLIFSLLAYRSRQNRGASINEIARETRLHKATIKRTLQNLQLLAYQFDGQWICNEPSAELFKPLPNPRSIKHWSDRFCYINYYPPTAKATLSGKRFGVNHAVVISTIVSFTKQANPNSRLSIQLISSLNEINRKTVSSIFDDLLRAEIIRYESGGIRLELREDHLALFQMKEESESLPPAEPSLKIGHGKYQYRQDPFDKLRKLCEPLFAQSYAEDAIALSRKLGMSDFEFEDALRATKKLSDENIKSGKCTYSNLGRFFTNQLKHRWEEVQRIEIEAEQKCKLEAYLNSDEYKQKRKQEEESAKADPASVLHTVNAESITDRVHLDDNSMKNRMLADNLLRTVHLHCRSFVSKLNLPTQAEVDTQSNLRQKIVGQALKRLNHHYESETKATKQELETAIDEASATIDGLGPVFNKSQS